MDKLLSASILSANFAQLEDEIRVCEQAGVDWIHIDVMDGHFVPNITMGPFIVETCRKITQLPLDCHLMVENPETLVESFIKAGATYLTIHPENNSNVHRTLQYIRNLGCKPGIALNPGTPAAIIEPLLPLVELVLVMTVNPGFSGQAFIPEMVYKIEQISGLISKEGRPIHLEVDGGITPSTILATKTAGANTFVSATSIFKNPQGIASGVSELRLALVK